MNSTSYINKFRDSVVDAEMPMPCKMTLMVIARYANSKSGTAFPSQKTIADHLGIKERAVRRHIAHLVATGWLEIIRHAQGGNGRNGVPNIYKLTLGSNDPVAESKPPVVVVEAEVEPVVAPKVEPEPDKDGWTTAF